LKKKIKMAKKFLRRTWSRYSKLGKGKKKKQIWRRPRGRDNKMREKRRGYPAVVSIGYKKDKKTRESIKGKQPVVVRNIQELKNIKKNQMPIIGNIGNKKKIELAKIAKEKKIQIHNLNIKKFLKQVEKKKPEEKIESKIKNNKKEKEKKK